MCNKRTICDDIRFRQIFAKNFDYLRFRKNMQKIFVFIKNLEKIIVFPKVVAKICVRKKQLRVTAVLAKIRIIFAINLQDNIKNKKSFAIMKLF
jgi:hypothetical protein